MNPLSPKNQEILDAATAFEEVLEKNGRDLGNFVGTYLDLPVNRSLSDLLARWQAGDDKRAKIDAALSKLTEEERELFQLRVGS